MIKVICWWGRGQVVRVPGAGAMVRVVAEQPDALRAVVGGAAVPAEGVRARACHPGAAILFLDALAALGAEARVGAVRARGEQIGAERLVERVDHLASCRS